MNSKRIMMLFLMVCLSFFHKTDVTVSAQESLNITSFAENLETLFAESSIPGAIVVLTDSNGVLLEKGFGYRDIESAQLMDPETTIFRMASVAKAYTFIGIMQLIENGTLDLDSPINAYMDSLKIDYDQDEAITVRHLLTHTEGFQNNYIGILTDLEDELISLSEFLTRHKPVPFTAPGQQITYGNDGANVAGLIIENQTDRAFEQYMRSFVFEPLNMNHTGFQKIPAELKSNLASEYVFENDRQVKQDLVYPLFAPGGGIYSSATDQSHFLQAMLNGGHYLGQSILTQNTIDEIFSRQFSNHEHLPGMTFGFIENLQYHDRYVYRDGDGIAFKSRIAFIPTLDLGIMIYSNNDHDMFRNQVMDALMNHVSSKAPSELVPIDLDLASYTGYYRINTFPRNNFGKIQTLFSGIVNVSESDDRSRLVVVPFGMGDAIGGFSGSSEWIPVDDHLFASPDGLGMIAFASVDNQVFLYSGSQYLGSFEKMPVYESPIFLISLLIGTVGISGLFMIIFPVIAIVKLTRNKKNKLKISRDHYLVWLGLFIINVINSIYLGLSTKYMFVGENGVYEGFPEYGKGIHPALEVLMKAPYLLSVLCMIVIVFFGFMIKNKATKVMGVGTITSGLLIVNQILLLSLSFYWHLYI